MRVVLGEVVGDAGKARVHVGTAELLRRDFLAGRGFDEGRAAEKDGAGSVDDDRFIRHRRDVGAAGRARAHDHGNLGDPGGGHARLVEENPAEMIAIGEDLRLEREKRAARIDQVDARQPVFERDLLGADVLLHGDRVVGAALHRRVVGDDDDFTARDAPDAGHQAGRRAPRCRTCRTPRACDSSRNGDPRSSRRSTRSRTGSFPCSRWRCRYFGPPPCRATSRRSRSCATSCCMRSRLALKLASLGSTWEGRTCMSRQRRDQPRAAASVDRMRGTGRARQRRVDHGGHYRMGPENPWICRRRRAQTS